MKNQEFKSVSLAEISIAIQARNKGGDFHDLVKFVAKSVQKAKVQA